MLALVGFVAGVVPTVAASQPTGRPGGPSEPIRYVGHATVDPRLPDGGLPWAVGVQSYQVLRASRLYPQISDGQGWTFHHAPAIAYWNGRFYVEFIASPIQENGLPTNVMMATSADGHNWSMPEVIFPQWDNYKNPKRPIRSQLHQRMGFYIAPNGKLLVISHYGLWDSEKNDIFGGPGHVVREVHTDGSLGPIYFVRYGKGWDASNTPYPSYQQSPATAFVKSCEALLASPFVTDQWYELEKGYPPNAYIKVPGTYHPDSSNAQADKHQKALSFFHRKDGVVVGIWKKAWTALSSDGGKTWSTPVEAPGFARTFAKLWGQRTSDDRYAVAYDPVSQPPGYRWPLAVVTSKDGITFNHLLVVEGEVPVRRYSGFAKDNGPQYVRGISENNLQPPDGAMWLAYSMNKEDIWVSRVSVPIRGSVHHAVRDSFNHMAPGGVVTDWNIYSPRWAPVEVVSFPTNKNRSLELEDADPYDYARAVRIFPASIKGEIGFRLMPRQRDSELDIDLLNARGKRPVRIVLEPNGQVKVANGDGMAVAASYKSNQWLIFKVNFNATLSKYSVVINGQTTLQDAAFAEPVKSLQRVSFRTGPYRGVRIDQSGSGRGNEKHYYVGHIDPETDRPLKRPAVYFVDDVWSRSENKK